MLDSILSSRYKILQRLGGGSFGQTYLALDTQRPHSPKCVVKHLMPLKNDAEFMTTARSLFQREAETLEKLGNHDQVPRLLAYFEVKEEFYLVQDYIPGTLLSQELSSEHPWNESQAIAFLENSLGVLEFIHQLGVIHRDLKPDNIIRRQTDGKLVLIDFGAVKTIQSVLNPSESTARFGNTITIGTPGYMAPEQAQGRPRPGSDLYSIGIILIQALTGTTPSQLEQDADGEFQWVPQRDLHPRLLNIVKQMVRYHFQDRYQQASEIIEDLRLYTHPPQLWQRVKHFLLGGKLVSPQIATPEPTTPAPTASVPVNPKALGTTIPRDNEKPQNTSKGSGKKVVLSAFSMSEESSLTQAIYTSLVSEDFEVFVISQSQPLETNWVGQLQDALKSCDFYILMLCAHTASSEVLLQEIRTVKSIQASQTNAKPTIIPIRVEFPFEEPLNFELRGYLQRVQQYLWKSTQDTDQILQQIFRILKASPSDSQKTKEGSGPTILATIPPIENNPKAPPQPVAEPEIPAGQVQVSSAFYIERPPIETRCAEVIVQPGALIRIKAPRQMGKTSLMARTLKEAQEKGAATVALSLQLADTKTFEDLDRLLQWLCATISRRLKLPNQIKNNWDDIFGSKYNCTNYFEEHILPVIDRPLVLGFDEVDRVFEHPSIASDFFGLLRAWHEEAKNQELWQKLRLIVVHATEVYIPLNANQSPFNVGLPVELPPFNEEQIQLLAQRYQLNWSPEQVQQIDQLIGGHPFLVRLAMYHISQNDLSFQDLLSHASEDNGLFRDHLRGYWWKLQKHDPLAQAFQDVLEADAPLPLEPEQLFQLHSLGLIHLQANKATPRCDLYRQYFTDKLASSHA